MGEGTCRFDQDSTSVSRRVSCFFGEFYNGNASPKVCCVSEFVAKRNRDEVGVSGVGSFFGFCKMLFPFLFFSLWTF